MDVASLADLLHETAEHHDAFEKAAPPHDWWDWYAAYMDAREQREHPGRGLRGRRALHGGGQARRRLIPALVLTRARPELRCQRRADQPDRRPGTRRGFRVNASIVVHTLDSTIRSGLIHERAAPLSTLAAARRAAGPNLAAAASRHDRWLREHRSRCRNGRRGVATRARRKAWRVESGVCRRRIPSA